MGAAEAAALEKRGWKAIRQEDLPPGQPRLICQWFESGLVAIRAEKEFPTPAEAMFEVEDALGIDIISGSDHDGSPSYSFYWDEPDPYHPLMVKDPDGTPTGIAMAMGWDCARVMYGAAATPRKTAELLRGQGHRPAWNWTPR